MNTNKQTMETPATTKSGRTQANRNGKTAGRMMGTAATGHAGKTAPRFGSRTAVPMAPAPAGASVALAPSFVALADQFGMVPERLAERVIAAFAATRPARIIVKARASSPRAAQ